jgi:hypothetical protein
MHDETLPRLPRNQARWERQLRIAAGIALFAFGLSGFFPETLGAAVRIVALVPLATGAFGWCPIYDALGFSTRGTPDQQSRGVSELRERRV